MEVRQPAAQKAPSSTYFVCLRFGLRFGLRAEHPAPRCNLSTSLHFDPHFPSHIFLIYTPLHTRRFGSRSRARRPRSWRSTPSWRRWWVGVFNGGQSINQLMIQDVVCMMDGELWRLGEGQGRAAIFSAGPRSPIPVRLPPSSSRRFPPLILPACMPTGVVV